MRSGDLLRRSFVVQVVQSVCCYCCVRVRMCVCGGVVKSGNVTFAGWQVTLCDSVWHLSSRGGEAGLLTKGEPLYRVYLLYFTFIYFTYFTLYKCTHY